MAAAHYVMFNGSGAPVQCLTGKKAEKALADIQKMPGYTMKQTTKEQCPFCTPKPDKAGQDQETPEPLTLNDQPRPDKPGSCLQCGQTEFKFKLLFIDHVMIRECRNPGCAARLNLVTMKPWESERK